jgi:uroporphyrinogen III methyltransferase/synthase
VSSHSTGEKPLAGLRVLVTRAKHQSAGLSNALRQVGAEPVELPTLEIVPLPLDPLRKALAEPWDWVLFTSANTVRMTSKLFRDVEPMPRVAAIGTATADALAAADIPIDLIPGSFVAEAMLEALVETDVSGSRVLLPVAESARSVLPDGLRAAGAIVETVPVYRTVIPKDIDPALLEEIRSGNLDVLTFASPSSVRNTLTLLGGSLPGGVTIACIGPITEQELVAAGYQVDIVATTSTASGLVEALIEMKERRP